MKRNIEWATCHRRYVAFGLAIKWRMEKSRHCNLKRWWNMLLDDICYWMIKEINTVVSYDILEGRVCTTMTIALGEIIVKIQILCWLFPSLLNNVLWECSGTQSTASHSTSRDGRRDNSIQEMRSALFTMCIHWECSGLLKSWEATILKKLLVDI